MDWEKERVKKLYEREQNYVETPVLRPSVNIFAGVQGGASERIKLLEKEREQKQQRLRTELKAKQREKQAALQHAGIKTTHQRKAMSPGTTFIKSVPLNLHQTGSSVPGSERKKKTNLYPASSTRRSTLNKAANVSISPSKSPSFAKISRLLSLAQKLLQAIQKGDMESVASLASKICVESAS